MVRLLTRHRRQSVRMSHSAAKPISSSEQCATRCPTASMAAHSTAGLAHHWKAGELAEVRQQLEERQLLHVIREPSGSGRPRDRYVALSKMGGK